jgi:hypothetical protein
LSTIEAAGADQGLAPVVDPANGTVAPHDPVGKVERFVPRDRLVDQPGDLVEVVVVDDARVRTDGVPDEVGRRIAGQVAHSVSHELHHPVSVRSTPVDDSREVRDERAEAFLALVHGLLSLRAP